MQMTLEKRGAEGEVLMQGRLDSTTAADAEKILMGLVPRFDRIILNLAGVEYVSSAGLSAFRLLHIGMNKKGGSLAFKNTPRVVMEVFELTGYVGLFEFV